MQPKLRFQNFNDNWKEQKIDEIATVVGGGTPDTTNVNYWNGDINWYTPNEILNNRYIKSSCRKITKLGLNKSSAKLLPPNKTVLFTSRANIGDMSIPLSNTVTTNQGFQSLVLNSNVNRYFILSMKNILKRKALSKASGSTFLEISKKDLKTIIISIPDKEEQTKIGKLFFIMDNLIEQADKQLKQYQSLKKGLLQKLFPQGKEDVPKIRFQGFSNKWEIKELSKIARIIGGGTPNSKNECYWNGDINWFTPTELGKSKYLINSKRKITKSGLDHSSAKLLPKGTILFTSRATIGLMGIITKDSCTNQGFQSIILNSHCYADFVYAQRFLIQKQALLRSSGSTFKEISNSEMKKINILVPSFKEQKLIGNIISCVDKLIVLQEKKINNLKALKQGLLQRMFC